MISFKQVLNVRINTQQIRFYPRWSHRTPIKVHTPEEAENEEKPPKQFKKAKPTVSLFDKYASNSPDDGDKIKWATEKQDKSLTYSVKIHQKPLLANQQKLSKKTPTVDMLETVIDKDGNFIYTKMENSDKRVGLILTQVKSRKEQEKAELILLEGKRLIKDALLSNCQLKYILFSRIKEVEYLKPYLPKIGAQLYKMPYKEMQMWSDLTTNPGIMGIFKVPNISNFEPKESIPLTIICDNIREPGNLGTILRICAGVGVQQVILTKGCVNLWETKVLRSAAGAHFKLNIKKSIEWPEIEKQIGKNTHIYLADNRMVSESNENMSDLGEYISKTPVLPYYGATFKNVEKVVLIVGGETEGISAESYKLAAEFNGARLNIPLSNDVDSLNVGAALGIIAFEIKRQLIKR